MAAVSEKVAVEKKVEKPKGEDPAKSLIEKLKAEMSGISLEPEPTYENGKKP